jgi:hypothetical protein
MQGAGECLSCAEGTTSLIGAVECSKPPAEAVLVVDEAAVVPELLPAIGKEEGGMEASDLAIQEKSLESENSNRVGMLDAAAVVMEEHQDSQDTSLAVSSDEHDSEGRRLVTCTVIVSAYVSAT